MCAKVFPVPTLRNKQLQRVKLLFHNPIENTLLYLFTWVFIILIQKCEVWKLGKRHCTSALANSLQSLNWSWRRACREGIHRPLKVGPYPSFLRKVGGLISPFTAVKNMATGSSKYLLNEQGLSQTAGNLVMEIMRVRYLQHMKYCWDYYHPALPLPYHNPQRAEFS